MRAEAERLAGTGGGEGEQLGPIRQGEAVVVPLERDEFRRHPGEQGVPLPRRGEVHGQGPFFPAGVGSNPSPQGVRQKLAAEADAEKGNGTGRALPYKPFHLREKPVPIGIVHPHRSAEDDGGGQPSDRRERLSRIGTDDSARDALLGQVAGKGAQGNFRVVLDDEQQGLTSVNRV